MEDYSKYNGEGTKLREAQWCMLGILKEFDKILNGFQRKEEFLSKNGFIHCGEISITCDFNDLPSLREAFMKVIE